MKRFFKLLLSFFLLLMVVLTVFFIWASSPTMKEDQYAKLITKSYKNTKDTDSVYSITTYNIGYLSGMTNNRAVANSKELFENNMQKVISEFKKLNTDIIAVQEIDYNSERSYYINQQNQIAKLGYKYIAEATNWDKNYVPFPYWPPSIHFGKMHSGQSILSKYKFNNYKRIVLDRVANNPFYRNAFYIDRLAQVGRINLDGREIIVINVHLEAFDKPTRVKQFNYVLNMFKEYSTKYPTILLGDFNSKARDKEAIINKIFQMDDIGNAAFNPENPTNTFDTKDLYERIDYIFYTKKTIEYIDGKVLNEFGQASDHLPIMMRFKLK